MPKKKITRKVTKEQKNYKTCKIQKKKYKRIYKIQKNHKIIQKSKKITKTEKNTKTKHVNIYP